MLAPAPPAAQPATHLPYGQKLKQSNLVIGHLEGSETGEIDFTNYGASL